MTWSYTRNGLYIAHQLRATAEGHLELLIVDFDGYPKVEPMRDEYAGIARQVELERALLRRGWALEEFASGRRTPVMPATSSASAA